MTTHTFATDIDIAAMLRAPGTTTDVVTAGKVIGISRTQAYALASEGKFPVTVRRVGKKYRVPIPALRRFLDLDE